MIKEKRKRTHQHMANSSIREKRPCLHCLQSLYCMQECNGNVDKRPGTDSIMCRDTIHHTLDQSAAITGIWGHGTNTATSRPRNHSQENILLYIQSGEIQIYSFFYWQFWKCIICVLYTSHKNINQLWLEKNIIIPRLETINISYFVHPAFA